MILKNILKRFFDILASTIAIVFLLIPWLVISIVIELQSPGPIIYRAKRIGKDGKVFTLYKFRSMKVDSGVIHATTLRNDDRIFAFGRFLRKSKLDETPQLWNILLGDMTVIGPRPEDEENFDRFYIGAYRKIVSVKPGLSSPASIYDYTHGEKYSDETLYVNEFLPQKLALELYYVNNWTLCYDLRIILRTIIVVLSATLGKKDFSLPKELDEVS